MFFLQGQYLCLPTHIFLSDAWLFVATWWRKNFFRMRLLMYWRWFRKYFLMKTWSGRFFLNVKISQNFIFLFEFFKFLDLVSFEFFEASINLMDLWLLSGINILIREYLWYALTLWIVWPNGIFLENHSTWVFIIDCAPSSHMYWLIDLFAFKRFENVLFILHHRKLNIWNIKFIEIYLIVIVGRYN